MAKKLFFCLFFIVSVGLSAQNTKEVAYHSEFERAVFLSDSDIFSSLLMADPMVSIEEKEDFSEKMEDFIGQLSAKQGKYRSQLDFVSTVFYKTHRKFLKRYRQFTPFGKMLRTGNYDCLSATSLYALLFERLGIGYEIVETNYHIYITVVTPKGNALIESTDAIYGYVTNPKEIEERLKEFEARNSTVSSEDQYAFETHINDRVSQSGLIGLQYYNASVNAYNNTEFGEAIDLLQKAFVFRNNTRMDEFGMLLTQTILDDPTLAAESKSDYINKLAGLLDLKITLASR